MQNAERSAAVQLCPSDPHALRTPASFAAPE
jgi:hypothetical protein